MFSPPSGEEQARFKAVACVGGGKGSGHQITYIMQYRRKIVSLFFPSLELINQRKSYQCHSNSIKKRRKKRKKTILLPTTRTGNRTELLERPPLLVTFTMTSNDFHSSSPLMRWARFVPGSMTSLPPPVSELSL